MSMRDIDSVVLAWCVCGFCFLAGWEIHSYMPKPLACEGTPFSYTETMDKSITCYYKLDPTSYTTTVVKRKG